MFRSIIQNETIKKLFQNLNTSFLKQMFIMITLLQKIVKYFWTMLKENLVFWTGTYCVDIK